MYNHILFPTDTSDAANKGFEVAATFARTFDAKITLLNVHEEFLDQHERQFLRVSPTDYQASMREHAVKCRENLEKLIEEHGVKDRSEIMIREGHPKQKIISTANELDVDLIVMSSNGRSNLAQVFLGSVAEYVVRSCKQPVHVVKV